MKKIFSLIIIVFILVFSISSVSASYNVGDSIPFKANDILPQTDGYVNSVTRTEEEQFMDDTNWSNYEFVSDIYNDIVSEPVPPSNTISQQKNDRLIITVNVPVLKSVLEPITYLSYYSDGYYYSIDNENGYSDQYSNSVSLSNEDKQELKDVAASYGYYATTFSFSLGSMLGVGSTPHFNPTIPGYTPTLTPQEITTLIQRYETVNCEEVREIDMRDTVIRDFTNYPERWEALDVYLNAMRGEDTIMTQRIIEVKVNDRSESELWSSIPQSWGYTGQSHYWNFECIESYDGNYYAPMSMFGGPEVSQAFYVPGRYQVTATQILNQQYCQVISYDVNEYWIIADTGQVIYKCESNGSYIPDTNKPLSTLGLIQVSNTKVVDEGTYYVTVLDQEVDVTSSTWNFNMSTPGAWGYSFSSQRIELVI